MKQTFADCWNLTSIDLSSFNTSFTRDMEGLFKNDYNLITLDLSSFRTPYVLNMNYMFANCYNLVSLDISNFNSSKATIEDIFANTTNLEIINSNDEKIRNAKPTGAKCELK